MLTRIKELVYDNVAQKFIARDPAGRKITVPLGGSGGGGSLDEGRFGELDLYVWDTVTVAPSQSLLVPFDGDAWAGSESDFGTGGLTYDADTHQIVLPAGSFVVKWSLQVMQQVAAATVFNPRLDLVQDYNNGVTYQIVPEVDANSPINPRTNNFDIRKSYHVSSTAGVRVGVRVTASSDGSTDITGGSLTVVKV